MDPLLERLRERYALEVSGLDAAQTQLRAHRHPDKWSIQQIVEHLLLTYDATGAAMGRRLAKGSATSVPVTVAERVRQMVVITVGFLPYGQRAPAMVVPRSDSPALSGAELCELAGEKLAQLDERLGRAQALFGRAKVMKHQALGPLSVGQWRRFQVVHGLHHLKQVRAIRREYGV